MGEGLKPFTTSQMPNDNSQTKIGAVAIDVAELYERLADRGYGYGPAFQGVQAAWHDGEDIYAEVRLA